MAVPFFTSNVQHDEEVLQALHVDADALAIAPGHLAVESADASPESIIVPRQSSEDGADDDVGKGKDVRERVIDDGRTAKPAPEEGGGDISFLSTSK